MCLELDHPVESKEQYETMKNVIRKEDPYVGNDQIAIISHQLLSVTECISVPDDVTVEVKILD